MIWIPAFAGMTVFLSARLRQRYQTISDIRRREKTDMDAVDI